MCSISRLELGPDGGKVELLPHGGVWFGADGPVEAVSVLLLNLGPYFHLRHAGVELSFGVFKWKLRNLQPFDSFGDLPETEEFHLCHVAELSRFDSQLLETGEVEEEIEHLRIFLSFAHGRWVSPIYTRGLSVAGETVYEQWRDTLTSRYRENGDGWLDAFEARDLSQLWPTYRAKRTDSLWAQTFDLGVYWLVRSLSESVGTDGGLILLQAALERMTWHYLVIEKAVLTKTEFNDKRYSAAIKLRMLLTNMSISCDIPPTLPELATYAAQLPHSDGPAALTSTRNSLVHPEKLKTGSSMRITEAYFLARNYTLLSLLHVAGHSGNYIDWGKPGRYKGEVKKVPWA